jgi:hypothetical protein
MVTHIAIPILSLCISSSPSNHHDHSALLALSPACGIRSRFLPLLSVAHLVSSPG